MANFARQYYLMRTKCLKENVPKIHLCITQISIKSNFCEFIQLLIKSMLLVLPLAFIKLSKQIPRINVVVLYKNLNDCVNLYLIMFVSIRN